MNELKILKVKDADTGKSKPLHPHLPEPPACVLMVSPVKTGKSTIISNLLLNDKFYGPEYFDEVMVISNTINNDLTSRFIKEHFDVEDHYNDSMMDSKTVILLQLLSDTAASWGRSIHCCRSTSMDSVGQAVMLFWIHLAVLCCIV